MLSCNPRANGENEVLLFFVVLDEALVDIFRGSNSSNACAVELTDAFNPDWISLFANAMITVGVHVGYLCLFLEVKIEDFVYVVVFTPFIMVLHHLLDFWNLKFSSAAKSQQVVVVFVAHAVKLYLCSEDLNNGKYFKLLLS
jgi:hypothetical protein